MVKGYTHDNSKDFATRKAPWGTGRTFSAQPARMSRSTKGGKGGSGNVRPPATHAKYGVDPNVGPVRMKRSTKNGKGGSGDARPPDTCKYVKGVPLKSSRTYGV